MIGGVVNLVMLFVRGNRAVGKRISQIINDIHKCREYFWRDRQRNLCFPTATTSAIPCAAGTVMIPRGATASCRNYCTVLLSEAEAGSSSRSFRSRGCCVKVKATVVFVAVISIVTPPCVGQSRQTREFRFHLVTISSLWTAPADFLGGRVKLF
jgi:hypothetical protein